MKIGATRWATLLTVYLLSFGCQRHVADKEVPPFQIVATDTGFEAPDRLAAGLRHIVLENRGTEIHEGMLVKLPNGMSADDYVTAVKKGSLFPEGALDYSGLGLTSPGVTAEMWLRVDPGQYIIICWNKGHYKTTPVHSFTVEEVGAAGPAMHEVDIYRLREGSAVEDLKRWRKENENGPAPAEALGGALDSHDISRMVWLRKEFVPGHYVLHCEMPVTNTKLNHADVGMVRELEIKE